MKFLFIQCPSDLYGAERSLLRLTSRLIKDGHKVKVILKSNGPLKNELEKNGIEVLILKELSVITRQQFKDMLSIISFLLEIPISVYKLIKIIKKFKPDIIHTNTATVITSSIAAKLTNIPHIWHVREFFSEFSNLWKIYQWFMYFFSDIIICVSTPVGDQFARTIIKKKIKIIHNGFPIDEFKPVEEIRITHFKNQFNIKNNLIIGVVGRIKFKRKGQDIFVRAIAKLNNKYSNIKYLIIGSPFPGNEVHLHDLIKLIKDLNIEDKIICTGEIKDIKAAYASLDILVLPGVLPEPFGGVVIEAMAFGKPVIGTNIGGTIEQIENNVTGFLIEPDNPDNLANAMEKLIRNKELRSKMGENGKNRYVNLFEFTSFYKKILVLYENILKNR